MILHGRTVKYLRGRFFAVPKSLGRADLIAEQSHSMLRTAPWSKVMQQPLGSRVLANQKRADSRRDARWRRVVVRARFT